VWGRGGGPWAAVSGVKPQGIDSLIQWTAVRGEAERTREAGFAQGKNWAIMHWGEKKSQTGSVHYGGTQPRFSEAGKGGRYTRKRPPEAGGGRSNSFFSDQGGKVLQGAQGVESRTVNGTWPETKNHVWGGLRRNGRRT